MFPLFRNSNRRYLFIFSVCISHQCTKFRDWRGGGGVEPRPRGQYPAEMSRGGWRVCTVYSVYCAVLCSTVLPGGSTVYTPTNFPDIFGHKLQSQLQLYTFVAPHRRTIERFEILHQIYLGKNQKTSGRPDEDGEDLQRLLLGCIMLYAGQSRNDIMLC